MFESFPSVHQIYIHDDGTERDDASTGTSELNKYLYRPAGIDGLFAATPRITQFYDKVVVSTKVPGAVRSALGDNGTSAHAELQRLAWPILPSHKRRDDNDEGEDDAVVDGAAIPEHAIFYSIINERPYFYYARSSLHPVVTRVKRTKFGTEEWYLRQICLHRPISLYDPASNPDPLKSIRSMYDHEERKYITYNTFQEAARALGVVPRDREGELALIEAAPTATPEALLSLFVQLTLNGTPTLRVLCGLGLDLDATRIRNDSDDSGDESDRDCNSSEESADSGGSQFEIRSSDYTDCDSEEEASGDEDDQIPASQLPGYHDPGLQQVRQKLMCRLVGATPAAKVQQLLCNIQEAFVANDIPPAKIPDYGIPLPNKSERDVVLQEIERWIVDPKVRNFKSSNRPTPEQQELVDIVHEDLFAVHGARSSFSLMYLDGKAGTGKTFTLTYVLCDVRIQKFIGLVGAPTNKAALLYAGGQSCHSLFHLTVPRYPGERITSTIKFSPRSMELIRRAKLIIIDELGSLKRDAFEAILQVSTVTPLPIMRARKRARERGS